MNAANYIKNQDDIQVVLHTVMFRGTPCITDYEPMKLMNSLTDLYKILIRNLVKLRKFSEDFKLTGLTF